MQLVKMKLEYAKFDFLSATDEKEIEKIILKEIL